MQAVAAALKFAVAPMEFVRLCGWLENTGGVWSVTTMVLVEYVLLVEASRTVRTMRLVPSGKLELLVGLCEMISAPERGAVRTSVTLLVQNMGNTFWL